MMESDRSLANHRWSSPTPIRSQANRHLSARETGDSACAGNAATPSYHSEHSVNSVKTLDFGVIEMCLPWLHISRLPCMRSQNATSKTRGGRRYTPYAFTEHGAIMAATVLNSPRTIQMSITLVTAFVKLRRLALSVEGLARKVAALENKYAASFRAVFKAIRDLMKPGAVPCMT